MIDYEKGLDKLTDKAIENMQEVLLNACKLYNNDGKAAIEWFFTDSHGFGFPPIKYVFADRAESILSFQRELLGEV